MEQVAKAMALAALLAGCAETSTKWDYDDAIYIGAGDGPDHGGYSAPSAGHSDPVGVAGVDSPATDDGPADSESDTGADHGGDIGDVGKGHDDGDHDDGDHDDGDHDDGDHDGDHDDD